MGPVPELDDVAEMIPLQRKVQELLLGDETVQEVAFRLLASSFYFQVIGGAVQSESHGYRIQGLTSSYYRPLLLSISSRVSRNVRAWKVPENQTARISSIEIHLARTESQREERQKLQAL